MSALDQLRGRAGSLLARAPGRLGDLARRANDALGRPIADAAELADRRAFAQRSERAAAPASTAKPAQTTREPAPVIVYHMDKTRRDAHKLSEILDAHGVKHLVTNVQEDPAAQAAVRRDSNGIRLPVVFIAGECVGGRAELVTLAASGELQKKVFG